MQFHVANRDPVTGRIKPLSSVTAYLTPRRNTCSYHLYHRILLDALLISASSPPPLHLLLLQIIVTYLLVDSFRSNFAIRTYFIEICGWVKSSKSIDLRIHEFEELLVLYKIFGKIVIKFFEEFSNS